VTGKKGDPRLAFLREGDVLIVTKPDRLARSTMDLLNIEADLTKRKAGLAVQSIHEEAGKLKMTAEEIERQQNIRERAYEIWIEHGRPEGRDLQFWLAAEREVDINRPR
jgi:DNA invertase Pin-like site-specific DNA recombinase